MGIAGILFTASMLVINPVNQIKKVNDVQRKRDLEQIKTALDVYYNDNNCYPNPGDIPFGSEWLAGNAIYMKKVPQDSNYPYVYDNNGIGVSSCPQWGVLFARLDLPSQSGTVLCPLENQGKKCLPDNYTQKGYNYCVVSGVVDCDYLATSKAFDNIVIPTPITPPTQGPTSIITITPTPGGNPTPTPTSTPTTTPTLSPTPPPTIIYGDCFCSQGGQPGGPLYDIRSGNCNRVDPGPYNYCDSRCTLHCR